MEPQWRHPLASEVPLWHLKLSFFWCWHLCALKPQMLTEWWIWLRDRGHRTLVGWRLISVSQWLMVCLALNSHEYRQDECGNIVYMQSVPGTQSCNFLSFFLQQSSAPCRFCEVKQTSKHLLASQRQNIYDVILQEGQSEKYVYTECYVLIVLKVTSIWFLLGCSLFEAFL